MSLCLMMFYIIQYNIGINHYFQMKKWTYCSSQVWRSSNLFISCHVRRLNVVPLMNVKLIIRIIRLDYNKKNLIEQSKRISSDWTVGKC